MTERIIWTGESAGTVKFVAIRSLTGWTATFDDHSRHVRATSHISLRDAFNRGLEMYLDMVNDR